MEKTCLHCGKPIHGRADKKFCCDECRTDYHNHIRRESERGIRTVNRILASNWKILTAQLRNGISRLPVAELAGQNFNFKVYTNSQWTLPGHRTYWCYNCAYRISRSGVVHIWEGTCRNNTYL